MPKPTRKRPGLRHGLPPAWRAKGDSVRGGILTRRAARQTLPAAPTGSGAAAPAAALTGKLMKIVANRRRPRRKFSFLTRISQVIDKKNVILKRDSKKLTDGLSLLRQGRDAVCRTGCGQMP
ncbi:MAG: hypothetical protein IOD00_09825 [Rhodobacter sp.]|nr:hypothetical protein [Rhodobacter sp.]